MYGYLSQVCFQVARDGMGIVFHIFMEYTSEVSELEVLLITFVKPLYQEVGVKLKL